ncbi:MAG: hypothetical protein JXA69_20090 [Phycisphaerae bacterium]|nr:hypothetical protein [Phycisphaerae bacterium]
MAVTPINFSRVSHNLRTMSLLDSLRKNTMALFAEQNRLSTGKLLNAPSDDPVAASKALNLTQILDRQEQVLYNIRHADSFLAATDNEVSQISDLLLEAKTIASDMVNSVVLPEEREAKVEVIKSIVAQLIAVGNRTYNGVQLFAGKKTLSSPFTRELGGVTFTGDTTALNAKIGGAEDAVINLTGAELYGVTTGQVLGYQNLEPIPLPETRLVDLKGATELGIRLGQFQVLENGGATAFTVDVTGADSLGNVVAAINAASADAGATVTASVLGTGIRLTSGGGFDIEVRDSGNGTVASDLGIRKTAIAGVPLDGDNLHAKLVNTTPVPALGGGTMPALVTPIRITNGTLSADIDLGGAQSVQDILNAINTAKVAVRAVINDTQDGINVINLLSGQEMRIADVGGGTTAEDLGIRTLHADTSLADLNHGDGVSSEVGKPDFQIVGRDGTTLVDVDVSGATTIQDVIDAINAAGGGVITASLNPDGTGLRIDDATGGAGVIRVQRLNGSFAMDGLGLNKTSVAGDAFLISDDVAGVRPKSVFSVLLDLEAALQQDDTQAINRAGQELETFVTSTVRVRGIVGSRAQAMSERVLFTEDAVQATRTLLSQVQDLDYTEAVTRFQQAQTALEANLMTGSRLLTISLLDFLG